MSTNNCVETCTLSKIKIYTVTLCLSHYGDKYCKLYVLMFGLWLFGRFKPSLILLKRQHRIPYDDIILQMGRIFIG